MPQPNSPPQHNNHQYGGVPFGAGAGWAMPPQNNYAQQPPYPGNSAPYPSQTHSQPQQPPYPGNSAPYPSQPHSLPHQAPYPGAGGAYPPYSGNGMNSSPYPSYPSGNAHYQQPPYPSMGQPQSSPPQHDNRPVSQPPYPGAFNYMQHQPPAPSSQQFHQQHQFQQQFSGHETHSQVHSLNKVCICHEIY